MFDLGGNVAEWAMATNGQGGGLLGGSADRLADGKAGPLDAAPAYRGFRVVKDAAPRAP